MSKVFPDGAGQRKVQEAIEHLLKRQGTHFDVAGRMMKAYGGNVYCMDLLATAVLNRSVRLIRGFADQIKTNFLCAAPLVRMQADNFLRFNAARFVDNLNDFVMEVLRGIPIRKIKDRAGQPMTDAYLLKKAAAEYPNIEDIYDRGCGYIHLCDVHILHAIQVTGEMQADLSVSVADREITDEHRVHAIHAMTYVTDLVLRHVDGWVQTKSNPELAADPMKRTAMLLERGQVTLAKQWLQQVIDGHHDQAIIAAAKAKLESLK